jgi:hypothetical protein
MKHLSSLQRERPKLGGQRPLVVGGGLLRTFISFAFVSSLLSAALNSADY